MPFWLAPNIMPNPNSQNNKDAIQKSTTFLPATWMLFFARTNPLSRQVKPACIMMTRMAQKTSQKISKYSDKPSTKINSPVIGIILAFYIRVAQITVLSRFFKFFIPGLLQFNKIVASMVRRTGQWRR